MTLSVHNQKQITTCITYPMTISIHDHPQIATCVTCSCGRGYAKKGLQSLSNLWQSLLSAGWSIDGHTSHELIEEDCIKCPVCNGRMTAEEYKIRGE